MIIEKITEQRGNFDGEALISWWSLFRGLRLIKEQNNFCDNQSTFYNKKIEDRIKIVDIEFKDKNYNMYVYRKADIVSQSIIENKNYEKSQTEKAIVALNYYSKKKNIKNEDIYIIDIGANIGWYTFIFGKYGYKVIAFEPSELNTVF